VYVPVAFGVKPKKALLLGNREGGGTVVRIRGNPAQTIPFLFRETEFWNLEPM